MALSEIEKLERRYAENPQGLTFAPLAEVHRKNGDVTRALELLRSGLTVHPDYIPASIVLGRCHLDLGDLPSAETAFAHVLSLDGENVIALKALADIAERQYRFDDSERWLHSLLAVDRSNDEAREQLSRVEASHKQARMASSASPDAAPAEPDSALAASDDGLVTGGMAAEVRASDEQASSATDKPVQPEAPSEPMLGWVGGSGSGASEAAPLDLEELDLTRAEEAERPAGIEIDQTVTLEEPVQPLSGLVGRDDQESGPDLHVSSDHVSSDGWAVETAEDIVLESAGASEFQVANAAEELLSKPARQDRSAFGASGQAATDPVASPAATPESTAAAPAADEPSGEPIESAASSAPVAEAGEEQPVGSTDAAAIDAPDVTSEPPAAAIEPPAAEEATGAAAWTQTSWSPPTAEPPRQTEADLLVTESMAELLLQQGHTAEALTVYRHLQTRTGDDRFSAKIAELESGTRTPAFAEAPLATAPAELVAPTVTAPAAAATPAYSVQQTHGESVHAFLRGVLGARPPAAPPAASAPPERGAAEGSAAGSAAGAPTRPAHDSLSLSSVFGEESTPTPPAVPTAGAGGAPGGVSYDEFFGSASSAPARPSRTPDAKSDDLDQFHAWLQNLKR